MKLQLLLFSVLLRLSTSVPTGDECDTLTKPVSLEDHSVLAGSGYLLYGYTDNDVYNMILNMTESSAFNITVHNGNVTFHEENKLNGTCFGVTAELEIKDNAITTSADDMISSTYLLPSCEGCYLFMGNSSAKNLHKLLHKMHLHVDHMDDVVNSRTLYFFGHEPSAKDEDLQHFKKQAHCLGFNREPDFIHHSESTFCQEGEGVQLVKAHHGAVGGADQH